MLGENAPFIVALPVLRRPLAAVCVAVTSKFAPASRNLRAVVLFDAVTMNAASASRNLRAVVLFDAVTVRDALNS
jgi:hypothetical protein